MSNARRFSPLEEAPILIAYYREAYGLTLRIDVQALGRLIEIKESVERLASGQLQPFSMDDLSLVAMQPPVKAVTLAAMPDAKVARRRPKIRQVVDQDGGLAFRWEQTVAEWQDTRAFLQALCTAGSRAESGHQYLTDATRGGTAVELSLNE